MSDKTIILKKPVTLPSGERISQLDLREPTGGDIERMQTGKGSDIARSYALIADLAQVDPVTPRLMGTVDLARVNKWLEPLLDPQDLAED